MINHRSHTTGFKIPEKPKQPLKGPSTTHNTGYAVNSAPLSAYNKAKAQPHNASFVTSSSLVTNRLLAEDKENRKPTGTMTPVAAILLRAPTPISTNGANADFRSNLDNNIRHLEARGYTSLVRVPLPDIKVLREIQKDPKNYKVSSLHLKLLIENMQIKANQSAQADSKNAENIFNVELEKMILAIKKITQYIADGTFQPIDDNVPPGIINKMGGRLFIKNRQLFLAKYSALIKPLPENSYMPIEPSKFCNIFGIVLAKQGDSYFLEHRLGALGPKAPFQGHPTLMDDMPLRSILNAGEEFHKEGQHKLSSNLTGIYYEHLDAIGLTLEDQQALLNICLCGNAGTYYKVVVKPDKSIDYNEYREALITAGADCPPHHGAAVLNSSQPSSPISNNRAATPSVGSSAASISQSYSSSPSPCVDEEFSPPSIIRSFPR